MENISYELINKLNDEEIQSICKYADLDLLLIPFRKNIKKYDKYIKTLGRLDKRTQLVQTLLPKYTYDLYKKGDVEFVKAISMELEGRKENFLSVLSKCRPPSGDIEKLKTFQNNKFVDLYFDLNDISNGMLSYEAFVCDLKICDVYPGEDNIMLLKNQIAEIEAQKNQEKQFNIKLESELKKREKQILQKTASEKEVMENMLRNLRNELLESQKNRSTLSNELDKLKQKCLEEKEKMVVEWKADVEFEIMERKRKLLQELKVYEKVEKDTVEGKIRTFAKQLREKLDMEFEAQKDEAESKIEELTINISKLESNSMELKSAISSMKEQENCYKRTLRSLEKTEEDYFSNIKLRILEKKLDKFVFNKDESIESNKREESIHTTLTEQSPMIYEWTSFAENVEARERVIDVEDFINDLADNIAINFDHATEIAVLIISTLLECKFIIIESSIAQYIVESLSQIIDGTIPQVIETNGAKADSVINAIKESSHKVIFVDGVLNNFDEIMFASICRQVSGEKYLFFGVSQIKDAKMFSKATLNNALVLDIEDYMIISSDEPIIVGYNNLKEFSDPIFPSDCKSNYGKFFKVLVAKSIISKKSAFDFSRMFSIYLKYMSSIGTVAKQCVSYYWNDTRADETDIHDLLEKAGWS